MAVDPYHRYSNESERADEDIYAYFKLKNPHLVAMFFTNYFSASRVRTEFLRLNVSASCYSDTEFVGQNIPGRIMSSKTKKQ